MRILSSISLVGAKTASVQACSTFKEVTLKKVTSINSVYSIIYMNRSGLTLLVSFGPLLQTLAVRWFCHRVKLTHPASRG